MWNWRQYTTSHHFTHWNKNSDTKRTFPRVLAAYETLFPFPSLCLNVWTPLLWEVACTQAPLSRTGDLWSAKGSHWTGLLVMVLFFFLTHSCSIPPFLLLRTQWWWLWYQSPFCDHVTPIFKAITVWIWSVFWRFPFSADPFSTWLDHKGPGFISCLVHS